MPSTFVAVFLVCMFASSEAVETCTGPNGAKGFCRDRNDCSNAGGGPGTCPPERTCCSASDKSLRKCHEYGKYVYAEDVSPVLLPQRRTVMVSQCGVEAVPLVVGGKKAHGKEFPHMVAIGYGEDLASAQWMCGGSLISHEFVLTAAHCSKSRDRGFAAFARLGDLNLKATDDDAQVQDFVIAERINHPDYKPPSRYHDIALFRLSAPVEINGYVRPACLHTSPDEARLQKAIVTGWGKLDYNDKDGSDHLMKVTISMIDKEQCNSTFAMDAGGPVLRDGVVEHQLCAGELEGGKDTCQGDSGGPLQVMLESPHCMYEIVGVTSFGKFCGMRNSPAIYTKVSHYVPWIESIVWP